MKKILFIRIFLALGSTIFTLLLIALILEIYLRKSATFIIPHQGILQGNIGQIILEGTSGRRMAPQVNIIIRDQKVARRDIPFRTNSLGFRGEEIPKEKGLREFRILVLGDSITQAEHLLEEEIFTSRLKEYLSKSVDKEIKVINSGVADVGIKEEVDILEENVTVVKPDIVLVAFYLNDSRPPWGFPQELGRPGWLRIHSLLADKIYRDFKLYQFVTEKGLNRMKWAAYQNSNWKTDRDTFLKFAQEANLDWGAAWNPDSWKTIETEFTRLGNIAQDNKFKVVIVFFPVRFQVYSDFLEDYPQRKMDQLTQQFGFYYLDLLPFLRENNNIELFYDWAHPQPHTNDLIGKKIAEYLISQKFID